MNHFAEMFSQTRLTISSGAGGCSVPFAMHRQCSSMKFLCYVQICIAAGAFLANSLTNAQSCVTRKFYFYPRMGFYFARVKTGQVGTWSLIE